MSTQERKTIALLVRDLSTREIVHRVEITGGKGEAGIDRVERGLLMRIDDSKFYVDREYDHEIRDKPKATPKKKTSKKATKKKTNKRAT